MFVKSIFIWLAISFVSGASVAQSQQTPIWAPLPSERVFPIEGAVCACTVFPSKPLAQFEKPLLSSTPTEARVLINGVEHQLSHVSRVKRGTGWTNEYSNKSAHVSLHSTEVPFAQSCSLYPDPPMHGSCFVGQLSVKPTQGRSQSVPVVEVCGC